MFCSNCACELPTTAKFCVRCGSTVDTLASSTLARVAAPSVDNPSPSAPMQCSKCSCQNPSDYSFCTACGASLRPIGSPVFMSSTLTAFSTAVPSEKNKEPTTEVQHSPAAQQVVSPLRGVGGWLLLFCVGLVFLAPLYSASEILDNPTDMLL